MLVDSVTDVQLRMMEDASDVSRQITTSEARTMLPGEPHDRGAADLNALREQRKTWRYYAGKGARPPESPA
jgi:hypothetical protein